MVVASMTQEGHTIVGLVRTPLVGLCGVVGKQYNIQPRSFISHLPSLITAFNSRLSEVALLFQSSYQGLILSSFLRKGREREVVHARLE